MNDSDLIQEAPVEARRVPLEREVVLEFEHFSSFIREYSANISLGGMFIKTGRPHLPGTIFRFEVRLTDDAPLISGLAKVLWVRETQQAVDRPCGMGVRFLHLEAEALELIEQIVREHVTRGGRPFRLAEAATPGTRAGASASAATAEAEPSGAPESERPAVPMDRSTVIDLPRLEDLLEEARTPTSTLTLDTPPRGWKPGIHVAQPRTRPQLIGAVAVGAAIVGVLIFVAARIFGTPAMVDEAETEPVALPRAQEPAEEPLRPFTAVEEISWQRAGNGAEIVVLLNGSVPDGSWAVQRISDPPRHLLKFVGAARPYPTETFEVGFGGVRQIRTGFHDGGVGNEQHLVIDLVDPRVVLEETSVEGPEVRLRFRRLP